jgi:hypothetical protein
MSDIIQLPGPPATDEVKSHYFIYGEWTKVIEASKVVAPGSAPEQDMYHKIGMNEAIAMHPAVFVVLVQEQRPGYTVKAWSRISKELFDWWIDVESKKRAAIQLAMAKNGGSQ